MYWIVCWLVCLPLFVELQFMLFLSVFGFGLPMFWFNLLVGFASCLTLFDLLGV